MVPDSTNAPSPADRTSNSKIPTPPPVASTFPWPSPPRAGVRSTLLEPAARALPGGVLGSSRFPDDLAFIVRRGSGSKLYDVSGREYIDYLMGSGPLILGHAHPAVVAAVRDALEHGSTYFLVNEPIVALADELCRAVPCAEQVRFTSTGTEATFFALRAARAFRGRDKVMKFEGDHARLRPAPGRHPGFRCAGRHAERQSDRRGRGARDARRAPEARRVREAPPDRTRPARRPGGDRPEVRPGGAGDRGDDRLRRRLHGPADHRLPRDADGGRRSPEGLQRGVPAAGSREGRVEDLRHARPRRRRRRPDARGVRRGHRRGLRLRATRARLTHAGRSCPTAGTRPSRDGRLTPLISLGGHAPPAP